MLRYFPVAYEDELLYSLIGRYHIHTCSPSFKQTLHELFGSKNLAAVVDLPAHLERLHHHTSHMTRQNVTDILLRQTLYPLFAPFLGPELAAKVRASMLSDNGGDVHTRAGIVGSRLKRPAVLRVCPVCYQEQVRLNGEACWQRLFQVTGVQVCPEHRVLLHHTSIPYVPINKPQFWAVPRSLSKEKRQLGFSPTDLDKLILVAKDMRQLLRSDFPPLNHAHWTVKYWQLLTDKGLTKGHKVNHPALHEEFVNFWGKAVLQALSCQVDVKDENSWLTSMARKHRKNNHPLMHILVYRYLAGEDAPLAELFRSCSQEVRKTRSLGTQRQNQTALVKNQRDWLALQKQYPGLSLKELRQHSPALYMRLYRQDRKWLLDNTPRQERTTRRGKRIDWRLRDRRIARQIVRVAKTYRKNGDRRRLSKWLLARSAGYVSLIEKHLDLLPVTAEALNKYSESSTEYQCRRIDRAVNTLRRNGERVVGWRIYWMARIRPDVPLEVKQYIRERAEETV